VVFLEPRQRDPGGGTRRRTGANAGIARRPSTLPPGDNLPPAADFTVLNSLVYRLTWDRANPNSYHG